MKKVVTIIGVFMLSLESYAQTVTPTANGAIIDCSALKSDAFTKIKKVRTTNGTDSGGATQSIDDIGSAINNEKIYYKFEVQGTDSGSQKAWKASIDHCASSAVDGGGWRLPTMRELMLIWVLNPELKNAGITPLDTTRGIYYRSATDFRMLAGYGIQEEASNSQSGYIRCIRDL